MKQGLAAFSPSRLFIYYNERVMEGSVNEDAGAEIRDGMKSISVRGVCPETMWPYAVSKFSTKPPKKCFTEALRHQAIQYMRVGQTLDQLKGCLADGFPFVFGFTVFDSFESDRMAKTGMMPMPKKTEQNLGGHAVMAVGYSEAKKRFLVRNSWGTDWALKGYFWMPYAYMTSSDLADDFWTLRTVEA
jgi:C1A family cysteine protease